MLARTDIKLATATLAAVEAAVVAGADICATMPTSAWNPIYIGKASHANWRRQSVIPTSKDELAGEAFFIGRRKMEIISRKEAKEKGLKRYFTGRPCKYGHVTERKIKSSDCIECAKNKDKNHYKKNKDKILNAVKNYRTKNKEKIKASRIVYTLKNVDSAKERKKQWRANNIAHVREKGKIYAHTRNAKKSFSNGVLSYGLVDRLLKLQRGKCVCCNQPLGDDYHLDHIMPLHLGGTNTDNNIQLLRSTCNLQKYTKHPVDFMQSRGFLL